MTSGEISVLFAAWLRRPKEEAALRFGQWVVNHGYVPRPCPQVFYEPSPVMVCVLLKNY